MDEGKELYEAIGTLAGYCSEQTDCVGCKLRIFCKSVNPVVTIEYIYNQLDEKLKANLLS